MCCFSRPIEHVSGTRIFARSLDDGMQALVYQMTLAATEALAMVLPLPVPVGADDDAVRFVSLEGYDAFFDDVAKAFPPPAAFGGAPLTRGMPPPQAKKLEVHQVGKFEASFVPTLSDFSRLDERFRMPDGVFNRVPMYKDWGFAVFQLKDFGSAGIVEMVKQALTRTAPKTEKIHPMAFVFPRRDPDALFFPTLHVHDGAVHDTAHFDHTLYLQHHDDGVTLAGWWSGMPAKGFVDVTKAKGLVSESLRLRSRSLHGALKNEDTFVRAT
jgi:hypothetical protein